MRTRIQEHVHSRRRFETGDISVYHMLADQVQVQIILHRLLISRTDRKRTGSLTSSYPRRGGVDRQRVSHYKNTHQEHTEWLSDLIPRGEEAEVDKCGHSDAWDRVPRKLRDKLKR
jgi:hypothetical protein